MSVDGVVPCPVCGSGRGVVNGAGTVWCLECGAGGLAPSPDHVHEGSWSKDMGDGWQLLVAWGRRKDGAS